MTVAADGSFGVTLLLRNSGGGTVWFDDVRIDPLPAGPAAAPSVRPLTRPTADPDLVLRWTGGGDPVTPLDGSGYGHHGKVHGTPTWHDEAGRRVLALDGKSTYVWPLTTPHLEAGPGHTIVMDIQPEAAGNLVYGGFAFEVRMEGAGPVFAVSCQPFGGRAVQSKPFLKAGEWQRLGIVLAKDAVLLYRNGELVERLAVAPVKVDWALHYGTTWHRHLSFFGYGPADMGLIPEPSGGHWKGRVRSVSVWKRELPADRLRTE